MFVAVSLQDRACFSQSRSDVADTQPLQLSFFLFCIQAWLGLCTPGESPYCGAEILSAEIGGTEGREMGEVVAVGCCLWSLGLGVGVGSTVEAFCMGHPV